MKASEELRSMTFLRWKFGLVLFLAGAGTCFWQIAEACSNPPKYLTVQVQDSGSVNVNPPNQNVTTASTPDSFSYAANSSVTLTPTPGTGYLFDHWENGQNVNIGSANPMQVTMTTDKTVKAVFVTAGVYQLTVSVTGSGSVSRTPQPSPNGLYAPNTVVTLTATAASGWYFEHWTGDKTGSTTPTTITMNSNKSVTAVFQRITYTLTTAAQGTGTVSPSSGTYNSGASVSLSATAGAGYRFDHWTGDLGGSTNPAQLTMNANKNVTAVFNQASTLTTSVQGSGTVSPNGGSFNTGSSITLTATPAANWSFVQWTGDLTGTTTPASLTMDANKNVTAVFVHNTYTLTTTADGTEMGTVSPSTGPQYAGDTVSVSATANTGYRFDHWIGDLSGSTNPAYLIMNANKAVTAVFHAASTLTTAVDGGGTVSPSSGSFNTDSDLTITATPSAGWRFDHWTGDLTGSVNPTSLNMNTDKSVTAVFVQTYTLTTAASGNGTVSPSTGTYDSGSLVFLMALPAAGSRFDHWTGDATGSLNPIFLIMDANKSVTAVFLISSTLTTSVQGSGTVSPANGVFSLGSTIQLTATPADGWRFDHWSGDLSGSTSPTSLTMNTLNKSVTAVFIKTYALTTAKSGSGSIAPASGTYDTGATVSISAIPQSGWNFGHWEGALTGSTTPTTLVMDADKSVTAVFVPITHTLTIIPSNNGSVSPPSGTYNEGVSLILDASPYTGWRFDHWEGDLSGTISPMTLVMNSNKIVGAVFSRVTYTLTTGVEGTGTISPATGPHNSGDQVGISASAGTGYVFHHWSGSLSGSANPTSILMNANKSVTAVFVQNFTLTTTVSGSGSGSIAPSGGTYASGTPLSLTPTAAPGSRFDHWEGALTGSAIPAPLTMDANKSVTAVFVRQYTLNTSVSGTGNGSVSPAGGTYDAGAQVTLTAAAVSGSRFVRWEGGLTGNTCPATLTMSADMNVTAVFVQRYTLTTTTTGTGDVVPSDGTYETGTTVSLAAFPVPGWRFDHWEGDLTSSDNPASLTIDANKLVTAVFTVLLPDTEIPTWLQHYSNPHWGDEFIHHVSLSTDPNYSFEGIVINEDIEFLSSTGSITLTPLEKRNVATGDGCWTINVNNDRDSTDQHASNPYVAPYSRMAEGDTITIRQSMRVTTSSAESIGPYFATHDITRKLKVTNGERELYVKKGDAQCPNY